MAVEERVFKSGEIIVKEGDIGKSFFRLIEGSAVVYAGYGKNDQIKLSVIEPGEYFGEMAIIEAYPRSATVVSKGSCTVIEIPEDEINAYFDENPDMISDLIKYLGDRITATSNDYKEAEALLKQLRESTPDKSKSLFSKIKKHINVYQSNKNAITEPSDESLREALDSLKPADSDSVKTYRKGMFIYREGKSDNCLFILHSGSVGFYNNYRTREEVKVSEISAVAIFGEMGMIAGDPRDATAVVESDGTIVESISPEEIEELFRTSPDKVIAILRHLSYRLRKLNIEFLNTCKEITEAYGDQ